MSTDKLHTTLCLAFTRDLESFGVNLSGLQALLGDSVDCLRGILDLRPDLLDGLTPVARACLWQFRGLHSKFTGASRFETVISPEQREQAAVEKFLSANSACANYDQPTSLPVGADVAAVIELARQQIQQLLGSCQGVPYALIAFNMRPGPGASAGLPHTDAFRKLAEGPATASTEGVIRLHRALLLDPTSQKTEANRSKLYGAPIASVPSKLSTVGKTVLIDRTTMSEPSCNMELQLATGTVITTLLKMWNIDLTTQQKLNGFLAKVGSEDGSYGTIDLSSASDTISIGLARRLLPREWFEWLMLIRSPYTQYRGDLIPLHMIATMGNGFCFPLQTLMFAALVRATYIYHGVRLTATSRWGGTCKTYGVFGDDMVVRTELYDFVTVLLRTCGFTVNTDKSFSSGLFRESCGQDWYAGHPVRPVFASSLDTVQEIYSLANRLARWSSRQGVPILRTLRVLVEAVPAKYRFAVPPDLADDRGFQTASPLEGFVPNRRPVPSWLRGSFYASWEERRSRYTLWGEIRERSQETVWRYRVPRSPYGPGGWIEFPYYPTSLDAALKAALIGVDVGQVYTYRFNRVVVKSHKYSNADGVLLCALGGYVTSGAVTCRPRQLRYDVSWSTYTPIWGTFPRDPRYPRWPEDYEAWQASGAGGLDYVLITSPGRPF